MNEENLVEPTTTTTTTDDAAKLEKKYPAFVRIDQQLIDLSNIEVEIKMEVG